jgi:hypothetical protein
MGDAIEAIAALLQVMEPQAWGYYSSGGDDLLGF